MKHRTSFARIIVRDPLGRFLVLAERRSTILWNFPGGKVEVGESARDAAIRELREETGLIARRATLVYSRRFVLSGRAWQGYFYAAHELTGNVTLLEPERSLEFAFEPLARLQALPTAARDLLYRPALTLSRRVAGLT